MKRVWLISFTTALAVIFSSCSGSDSANNPSASELEGLSPPGNIESGSYRNLMFLRSEAAKYYATGMAGLANSNFLKLALTKDLLKSNFGEYVNGALDIIQSEVFATNGMLETLAAKLDAIEVGKTKEVPLSANYCGVFEKLAGLNNPFTNGESVIFKTLNGFCQLAAGSGFLNLEATRNENGYGTKLLLGNSALGDFNPKIELLTADITLDEAEAVITLTIDDKKVEKVIPALASILDLIFSNGSRKNFSLILNYGYVITATLNAKNLALQIEKKKRLVVDIGALGIKITSGELENQPPYWFSGSFTLGDRQLIIEEGKFNFDGVEAKLSTGSALLASVTLPAADSEVLLKPGEFSFKNLNIDFNAIKGKVILYIKDAARVTLSSGEVDRRGAIYAYNWSKALPTWTSSATSALRIGFTVESLNTACPMAETLDLESAGKAVSIALNVDSQPQVNYFYSGTGCTDAATVDIANVNPDTSRLASVQKEIATVLSGDMTVTYTLKNQSPLIFVLNQGKYLNFK